MYPAGSGLSTWGLLAARDETADAPDRAVDSLAGLHLAKPVIELRLAVLWWKIHGPAKIGQGRQALPGRAGCRTGGGTFDVGFIKSERGLFAILADIDGALARFIGPLDTICLQTVWSALTDLEKDDIGLIGIARFNRDEIRTADVRDAVHV